MRHRISVVRCDAAEEAAHCVHDAFLAEEISNNLLRGTTNVLRVAGRTRRVAVFWHACALALRTDWQGFLLYDIFLQG